MRVVEFAVQWGYVFDGGLGYGLPKDDEFLMGCECCVVHGYYYIWFGGGMVAFLVGVAMDF